MTTITSPTRPTPTPEALASVVAKLVSSAAELGSAVDTLERDVAAVKAQRQADRAARALAADPHTRLARLREEAGPGSTTYRSELHREAQVRSRDKGISYVEAVVELTAEVPA